MIDNSLLGGLDQDQYNAVVHPHSTICIAGPGSGKTRALVAKAEYLFDEGVRDVL